MSETEESTAAWGQEFTGVLDVGGETTIGLSYSSIVEDNGVVGAGDGGDWRFQVSEFAKGAAEMSMEFGKGLRDVLKQSFFTEDSFIMRKFKDPCEKLCDRLKFLNEYLPEDREPVHSWTVISSVWVFALLVLLVNTSKTMAPMVKRMKLHPASASLIQLPDGRQLAYLERGVSSNQARHTIIVPHSFLSSRLAGIPGLKNSLLEEYGIRLVSYDLPGFGESDPHPKRNLESSAIDMLHLSNAVNVTGKFWVSGFSSGSMHAWAALRFIPDKLEGAIMFAPMVNPYEPKLMKKERRAIWEKWTVKRKMMYFLARKFPKSLGFFYRRSFLSGIHGRMDKWLHFSPGTKDKLLMENPVFEEFWQRDVEESIRQGNAKPFVEEAALQVSEWGFSIGDIKMKQKHRERGFISWLKSIYSPEEEKVSGFLGPIYIWQGAEDTVISPSTCDFVHRVLPDVMLHKLPHDGHFSYLYLCDACHQQIFATVFGDPEGKLETTDIEEEEDSEAADADLLLVSEGKASSSA